MRPSGRVARLGPSGSLVCKVDGVATDVYLEGYVTARFAVHKHVVFRDNGVIEVSDRSP